MRVKNIGSKPLKCSDCGGKEFYRDNRTLWGAVQPIWYCTKCGAPQGYTSIVDAW